MKKFRGLGLRARDVGLCIELCCFVIRPSICSLKLGPLFNRDKFFSVLCGDLSDGGYELFPFP